MCLLFGLGGLTIAISIWTLLDNPSNATQLEILITLPIIVITLCTMFWINLRIMFTKIVVSKEGIKYFKNNTVLKKEIHWNDVSEVYFKQEGWYGRKSCGIFLKKEISQYSHKKAKYDFVLPVYFVDKQKLLHLIPSSLWKNNPQYAWFL